MGPEAGKPSRRSTTQDRVPEAVGQPGVSGRAEAPPKSAIATAAKVLMPALKELATGLGTQHELVKEMLAAIQVTHLSTLAPANPGRLQYHAHGTNGRVGL